MTSTRPWNAGRAVGQKKAFTIEEARRLKELLKLGRRIRDLALASVAFDSTLRSCDLLGLTWRQMIQSSGTVRSRVTVRQRKTGSNVTFELGAETRAVLIRLREDVESDFVFPGAQAGSSLCARQYRRLVKQWARILGLDTERYGTHSLRRTKPAEVYRRTRDPEVARNLLGQRSLMATHHYLGIGHEEALERAREVEI